MAAYCTLAAGGVDNGTVQGPYEGTALDFQETEI